METLYDILRSNKKNRPTFDFNVIGDGYFQCGLATATHTYKSKQWNIFAQEAFLQMTNRYLQTWQFRNFLGDLIYF